MGASNTTTYDNYTPEQRAALAEAAASFKVYGDITSHLVSGSFSNGAIYSTAAGRGGYVEEIRRLKLVRSLRMVVLGRWDCLHRNQTDKSRLLNEQ